MSELIINGKTIEATAKEILEQLRSETDFKYYHDIEGNISSDRLMVTCPYHKGGKESHPSCCVSNNSDGKYQLGFHHCFTCGTNASLVDVVAFCLNDTKETAEEWLLDRFGSVIRSNPLQLTDIDLSQKSKTYLDERELEKYRYYHQYMWDRKLTPEIVDKFDIGYDPLTMSLTFPVRDTNGKLSFVVRRSVKGKHFNIPENAEKIPYLLNYAMREKFPFVIVCEGQIDALLSWEYGFPAVAMLGVPGEEQYKALNQSGITNFVTFFDNDYAGRTATRKFNKSIRKDKFITNIDWGNHKKKDIGELDKEEFLQILKENGIMQ